MVSIFYALSILFIWVEFYQYNNFDKIFLTDEYGEVERFNKQGGLKGYIFSIGYVIYSIWSFIGLFSDNSIWFGILCILSIFSFLKKASPKMFIWYSLFDLIVSVITLCVLFSKCFLIQI